MPALKMRGITPILSHHCRGWHTLTNPRTIHTSHISTYTFCHRQLIKNNIFRNSCCKYSNGSSIFGYATSDFLINAQLLDPQAVTKILTTDQNSVTINERAIRYFETNQLESNNPIEDTLTQARLLTNDGYLFGVFDGHGGTSCARYVRDCLFSYIAICLSEPETLNDLMNGSFNHDRYYNGLIEFLDSFPFYVTNNLLEFVNKNLLRLIEKRLINPSVGITDDFIKAFKRLDKDLTGESQTQTLDTEWKRDLLRAAFSGACANVVYIKDRDLYAANVGDCRAVLGFINEHGKIEAKQITRDHNTRNGDEIKRLSIEHPNEFSSVISDDRLLGILAPLRAFGDVRFKWSRRKLRQLSQNLFPTTGDNNVDVILPKNYRTPPYLSAEPDLFHHRLHHADRFLVLATDGLWDMLSPQRVCTLLEEHQKKLRTLPTVDSADIIDSSKTVDFDRNGATYLTRNALGYEHKHVSTFLTLPPDIARCYRDDITVTVVYFNHDYLFEDW